MDEILPALHTHTYRIFFLYTPYGSGPKGLEGEENVGKKGVILRFSPCNFEVLDWSLVGALCTTPRFCIRGGMHWVVPKSCL
jgi:hypothetical protein